MILTSLCIYFFTVPVISCFSSTVYFRHTGQQSALIVNYDTLFLHYGFYSLQLCEQSMTVSCSYVFAAALFHVRFWLEFVQLMLFSHIHSLQKRRKSAFRWEQCLQDSETTWTCVLSLGQRGVWSGHVGAGKMRQSHGPRLESVW